MLYDIYNLSVTQLNVDSCTHGFLLTAMQIYKCNSSPAGFKAICTEEKLLNSNKVTLIAYSKRAQVLWYFKKGLHEIFACLEQP